MYPIFLRVPIIAFCISGALADFLGPSYPAPVDLTSRQSLVVAGWRNFASTLQRYIDHGDQNISSGAVADIKNLTFSLGMFSLNDPAASELQFHYTSPEIADAPNGTHKVDENSIYRFASLTKVFTVLAGLLNLKDTEWDRPLTDIFPTLAEFAQKNQREDGTVYASQWNKITPSALAAQVAGVSRDILPFGPGDIALQILPDIFVPGLGLPPVNVSDPKVVTPCVLNFLENGTICTIVPYLESAEIQAPIFEPWKTPNYADNGFILLGRAIVATTGKTMEQLYQETIFNPLNMASSHSSTPPKSEWNHCVIPGDPSTTFAFDAGLLVSTGGLMSTISDLAKFGIGILNSTLLPPEQTRKWLKPVSHTARLQFSVGKPWEIFRYTHLSGHVTDIYTKLGDSGAYSSWLVLLPDYNAGFSILAASTMTNRFAIVEIIVELAVASILPALEKQAGIEAARNFAGTYTSGIPDLNSSLTLTHNQTPTSPPGLLISSWVSNGTDMITRLSVALGSPPWRLLPSISDLKVGRAAFLLASTRDAPNSQMPAGLFAGFEYQDWINAGSLAYGNIGVGSFVFDIGADGKATAVSPSAFRITLERAT